MKSAFADQGVVLKSVDFAEADKLVGLITHTHGYQEFVAKGARRLNSKKAPHLDLLNLIRFQAGRGRHPQILVQAESENCYPDIKRNFYKIKIALLVSEILTQTLSQEEEDTSMFVSLLNFLKSLDESKSVKNSEDLFAQFGLYVIRHLGFPPPPSNHGLDLIEYFEKIISRKIVSRTIK